MINQETFTDIIVESLLDVSDKEAFYYKRDNGDSISLKGGEVVQKIEEAAELFRNLGLKVGDRIVISSPPSPYYFITLLGAVKFGVVPMLIDHAISAHEFEEILHMGEIKTIVTIQSLIYKIPQSYLQSVPVLDILNGVSLSNNSVERVSPNLPPTTNVHPEVAVILFSSGTTSKMKGVEITHQSQILVLKDAVSNFGLVDYKSDVLSVLPFSHVAGLTCILAFAYFKSRIYMVENVNALKIAGMLQQCNPIFIVLIPKIYESFMEKIEREINGKGKLISSTIHKLMDFSLVMRRKYNINIGKKLFPSIRNQVFGKNMTNLLSGGTALNPKTMDFFTALGYDMVNVYASTETNVNMISTDLKHYDSSVTGKVTCDYVKVKILNPDSEGNGELVVKGPCLFYGYFKDEEITKEAYTSDGYFKTGDIAKLTSNGSVIITGRRKEAILLPNGEKVSPERIEAAYLKVMHGLSYAVCGVQLKKEIEYDTVIMFIEGGFSAKEQAEIKQKLMFDNGSIPENYRVSKVMFIQEIPKTGVGKIKRFGLKDIALVENEKIVQPKKNIENVMDDDSQEGRIRRCIRKCSMMDLNQMEILPEMNLYNDLGYDSLSLFQLCISIEEYFKKDFSECFNADTTVQDLYDMVRGCGHTQREFEFGYKYNIHDYPLKKNRFDEKVLKVIEKFFIKTYKITTSGTENIPADTPALFCPNHISEIDPLIVSSVFDEKYKKNLYCITWDKFTATRRTRYFMKLFSSLPIDRRSTGNATSTLKVGTNFIKQGKSLIVFPEGTRTYDGELATFQLGAAHLAKYNNIPIVPVTVIGLFDAYNKSRKFLRFRKDGKRIQIKIIFGNPIYGEDLSAQEFTNKVKEEINNNLHM